MTQTIRAHLQRLRVGADQHGKVVTRPAVLFEHSSVFTITIICRILREDTRRRLKVNDRRHVKVIGGHALVNGRLHDLTLILAHAPQVPPLRHGVFRILQILNHEIGIATKATRTHNDCLGIHSQPLMRNIVCSLDSYDTTLVENELVNSCLEQILASRCGIVRHDMVVVLAHAARTVLVEIVFRIKSCVIDVLLAVSGEDILLLAQPCRRAKALHATRKNKAMVKLQPVNRIARLVHQQFDHLGLARGADAVLSHPIIV